ncbi:DUF3823 domain-containing protein [Mucilaginibacter aquariorum]|uniref:DUF3823 domain-containing protein n=1 Tax=Mucilaginibacter aquariorum TaxID=2967225 RepID=A0ABT1SYT1_9SPHI|nr:DUF3823 domain-containing protein [Mucilaginibacter aquariorum]MCQ6957498.1 DUF3823 domain-containing protein [Mucilaginibacter aquariorum]
MKKIFYMIAICIVAVAGSSCSKLDNYPDPTETLTGSVIDAGTNKTLQTENGGGGTRIKLIEISWSDNPTPFYISSMQDGTFNYTKLFAGKNVISAEGAFVPLVQTDASGATIVDKSQTVDIKGTTNVNFSVDPFLRIEWIGEPVLNADGTITASFKFTRGTTDPNFQQDITDVHLFVNSNKFVGNNNFDNRYSPQIDYNGSDANAQVGQTITLTTKGGPLPTKREYFLRVGARTNYGLKYYNYTDVKTVTVP